MKQPHHVDVVFECVDCGEPVGVRCSAEAIASIPEAERATFAQAMGKATVLSLEHALGRPCPHCGSHTDGVSAEPIEDRETNPRVN